MTTFDAMTTEEQLIEETICMMCQDNEMTPETAKAILEQQQGELFNQERG